MKTLIRFAFTSLFFISVTAQASQFSNWVLGFHHDSNGNTISGSEQVLIDAIKNGADVKVGFPSASGGETHIVLESYGVNADVSPAVVWGITSRVSYVRDSNGVSFAPGGRISRDIFQSDGLRITETYNIDGSSPNTFTQNREIKWYISK